MPEPSVNPDVLGLDRDTGGVLDTVVVRAVREAVVRLPRRSFPWFAPGGRWIVAAGSQLRVLGPGLEDLATFPLSTPRQGGHSVSPDLSFAVISLKDRIVTVDQAGRVRWETEHPAWGLGGSERGSCWVTASGELVLATAPAADTAENEWLVLDADTGRRRSATPLDCAATGSVPVPHPDGVHVGLSVGERRHGAKAYWGDFTRGEPTVWPSLPSTGRIMVAVRPGGEDFLTTAHSGADIAVHQFGGGEVTARATAATIFGADHDIDGTAGYVTADVVITATRQGQPHALLTADTLQTLAYLDYPDDHAGKSVLANGNGTWLTVDNVTGNLQLWRTPHQ